MLKRHEAKWHKSCFNKCSTLKLQRAQKRKLEDISVEVSEAPSPVKTRTSLGIPSKEVAKESRQTCFFCDETGDNLRRAATLTPDRKVRAAATKLQDRKLFTNLQPAKCLPLIHIITQDALLPFTIDGCQ